MTGYINEFNALDMQSQKYWSFPSSYSEEKKRTTLHEMLYSGDYIASEKRDGYWQMILKDDDGNVFMRARSAGVNGWICKQEWVPHLNPFFEALPNGTCLISEVYIPGGTSKMITTILGCKKEKAIERQQEMPLRLSVFDVLAYDGELIYNRPITERITYLDKIAEIATEYIDIVTYWDNPQDIHENWLSILANGGEGVVLTLKTNPYEFNKRTSRHTLKMKKELQETVDVFLTGKYKEATKIYTGKDIANWNYWYDELAEKKIEGKLFDIRDNDSIVPVTKYWFKNMAGAIEIALLIKGKVVPIGWISGISDEDREGIVNNPESYKGKVIELQAMEVDATGDYPTFRHAKVVRWREDKVWQECVWNVE